MYRGYPGRCGQGAAMRDPMLAPCPRCGWRHPEPPEQCPFDWHKRETPVEELQRGPRVSLDDLLWIDYSISLPPKPRHDERDQGRDRGGHDDNCPPRPAGE